MLTEELLYLTNVNLFVDYTYVSLDLGVEGGKGSNHWACIQGYKVHCSAIVSFQH